MRSFEYEVFDKKQIENNAWCPDPEFNKYTVETAGFVPLEVKLRRFQENGQIMQFSTSEFTSSDYRDMYLNPDLEITPEMELEEIEEIQIKRQEFIKELLEKKSKVSSSAGTANPTSDSAAATKKSVQTNESKEEPLEKS